MEEGRLFEPVGLGGAISFLDAGDSGSDMLVLTNGCTVRRIGNGGDVKWSWTSEDEGYVDFLFSLYFICSSVSFFTLTLLSQLISNPNEDPFHAGCNLHLRPCQVLQILYPTCHSAQHHNRRRSFL